MNTKICEQCGQEYRRRYHEGRKVFVARRFCGRSCARAAIAAGKHGPLGSCGTCGARYSHGFRGMPHSYWKNRRYCSVGCAATRGRERWLVQNDGCWNWQLTSAQKDGYARVKIGRRRLVAHRVVFEELVRPLEASETLHHRCRNKLCVNPEHLEVHTRASHMALHMREDAGQRRPRSKSRPVSGAKAQGETRQVTQPRA